MALQQYKRRASSTVSAVQLALDTPGFTYQKWGAEQRCRAGDWIVRNGDDTYTVDAEVFARTYESVGPAQYRKVATVWAERAQESGRIATKEGATHYQAGDYLVYNEPDRVDGYAISAARFDELYELLPSSE
jgi:hypothetical protein